MGQALSSGDGGGGSQHKMMGVFGLAQKGELKMLKCEIKMDPSLLYQTCLYHRQSLLHIAAIYGQIHVLTWLLDQSMKPDVLNRNKQTPLMLAAMHGKISCVEKLLHAGANILMFDSLRGRTCLHYAAYYGHSDCLQAILSSARTSHVALSWGFTRFVNIRDGKGETPLHLAARQRRADCVHILLDNGALVCASTGGYGYAGSTPLHLAARGGSLDCIRELLAWGADRLQRDASGRIPYTVALKHKHGACAALLNPLSAEPLVWPSPLKFISELNPDAKLLLERALLEANREREKSILKGTAYSIESLSQSDSGDDDDTISEASDTEVCCICFDQVCTIEVQDCTHRMCAHCTLALCCHNKPNPTTASINPPVCPFCRSNISHLVVAKLNSEMDDIDNNSPKLRLTRRSWNCHEGSSSFKGLSTLGKMGGRGSGRISLDELIDKPSE
uniref:RING-type E3 ubiquitin transferase n=1 Tax=Mirabilis jalapa TaxID=3538 RepID=A4UQV7_MIRJA|nr:ubiquitin ligase [Mirabilis jalapa]